MYPAELNEILNTGEARVADNRARFTRLLTDSRKLTDADETLFFAIATKRNNGAVYIKELYDRGVRNFVVGRDIDDTLRTQIEALSDANLWFVNDVVKALQKVAEAHRRHFNIPVVGITGSNGKTIVKDWIVQLLQKDHNIVSSPKSYNSQIGVPLSVWQMKETNDMAVFEAGISETGEMESLSKVIQPTIGIFTNIGQAHDENFLTRQQKIGEKLHLFTHCQVLIYCSDYKDIHSAVAGSESLRQLNRYTWGYGEDNAVQLVGTNSGDHYTLLSVRFRQKNGTTTQDSPFQLSIPFVDQASIENAMQCVTLMAYLGYDSDEIGRRCSRLQPVAMRLEVDAAVNNCLLVNDGYSLDLNSLSIALDFVYHEHRHADKTLIISDFVQSGMPDDVLYCQVVSLVKQRGINKVIGIGEALCRNRMLFDGLEYRFYDSTEDFLRCHPIDDFRNETILLKGARIFGFERIAKELQRERHETVLEVNLDALVHNVNYYRSRIRPTTKLMAMVKASSYGAGMVEIANVLQFNRVDYLTVAYCDEGVELRRNGITLPIMVMNPEEECFDNIIRYNLEPDIYSFRILYLFSEAAKRYVGSGEKIPIHVEIDTGMHRLGFDSSEIEPLAAMLKSDDTPLKVVSVFSHLACSEDAGMDAFTLNQISRFQEGAARLRQLLADNTIMLHILNSSGITRFPQAQMDMVRLGIGLYGNAPEPDVQRMLMPVSTLKTRISQLKNIPKGDSVGYNRRWVAQRDSRIAILPIGYADGLSRHLGYGHGHVRIRGNEAPVIGSICMDMCFVDVTGLECNEGDEVTVFGDAQSLCRMAEAAGTIPYEILTSVSPRVKRVYVSEN